MDNPIVILGSSRSFGETRKAVDAILERCEVPVPVVDLNTLNISPYDYAYHNSEDDYLTLMEKIFIY